MDLEIQRVARELYKAFSGLNEEFERPQDQVNCVCKADTLKHNCLQTDRYEVFSYDTSSDRILTKSNSKPNSWKVAKHWEVLWSVHLVYLKYWVSSEIFLNSRSPYQVVIDTLSAHTDSNRQELIHPYKTLWVNSDWYQSQVWKRPEQRAEEW